MFISLCTGVQIKTNINYMPIIYNGIDINISLPRNSRGYKKKNEIYTVWPKIRIL